VVRTKDVKIIKSRKQAKLQWLQDPSKINEDNLNSLKREAIRNFRNKKREYLKDIINELATNVKTRTSETCVED
jgi:hypothetical protein